MSPVQLFVYVSETQLDIEFMIKKPIKTQCKTPHPQPLSPKRGEAGRGEQDQKMWVKLRLQSYGSAKVGSAKIGSGKVGSVKHWDSTPHCAHVVAAKNKRSGQAKTCDSS